MFNVYTWLLVWSMNFIFPYLGNVIIPADFHIFQRGRYTTNQDNIIILLPQKGHNMAQQKCVVAAIVQ